MGNYDRMSMIYKRKNLNLQINSPKPMKKTLSKRKLNSVIDRPTNDIKSRVSFLPAAHTHISPSNHTKFERMQRNEKKLMQSFELFKSKSKSKLSTLIHICNELDPKVETGDNFEFKSRIAKVMNKKPVDLTQAVKGLVPQFQYRMFLEEHLHDNLTTTLSLIKHIEDMEVKKSPYEFYKYQRDVLDEQKILAEEARKEYISGKSDPSLKYNKVST